ncbi:MAG: hypothetical protein ABR521_11885 [Gaiellaceae bacterium]
MADGSGSRDLPAADRTVLQTLDDLARFLRPSTESPPEAVDEPAESEEE